MKLNGNIWVTSDTHYSHRNICRSVTSWPIDTLENRKLLEEGVLQGPLEDVDSTRDFSSLEEMNETIVENINGVVGEKDWLIHDGDWSFGGFDKIEEFRSKINCQNIILLPGNHDHHIAKNKKDVQKIFSRVERYMEIRLTSAKIPMTAIFFHYPIVSWNYMNQGSFMLHGHQHLEGEKRFGNGKRMDVGIDGSPDFRPYHMDEIVDLLQDRKLEEWPPSHHNREVKNTLNPYS